MEKIENEIKKDKERIGNAQQLMLDGQIDLSDYRDIKKRYEEIISGNIRNKANLELFDSNYNTYMQYSCALLKNIDKYYLEANLEVKHMIISSIYPEKLIFENNEYRTTKINEVVALLSRVVRIWRQIKKD